MGLVSLLAVLSVGLCVFGVWDFPKRYALGCTRLVVGSGVRPPGASLGVV